MEPARTQVEPTTGLQWGVPRSITLDASARERLVRTLAEEMARRPDVSFAYLFGSAAERNVFRDVDVAIWTTPEARPFADLDIAATLSRRVQWPVDVRRINDAPVPFLFHALRGHLLVVRDESLLSGVMERTARQYHDMESLLRRATREAFAA